MHVNDNLYQYETSLIDVKENEVKSYQYNPISGKGIKNRYPYEIKPTSVIKYEDVKIKII